MNQFREVQVEKYAAGATGENVFNLRRLYSRHPSNADCRRILAFVTGTLPRYIRVPGYIGYEGGLFNFHLLQ